MASRFYTLGTYSLANVLNTVPQLSATQTYIWTANIPAALKGRNAIIMIFFNLYSATQFFATQYFDYGVYIDGVSLGLGDAGVSRYTHTSATNYAMNNAGISYGTNSISPSQPLVLTVSLPPTASQIQIGIKNSQFALPFTTSVGVAYISNNLTTTGVVGTPATFFPQTVFTSSGTYTVPTACSAGTIVGVFIYCWGGAGGSSGTGIGGAGGFVSGYYQCSAGTTIAYTVNGGQGNANQGNYSTPSGGYTGAFLNSVSQANAILVAGGGGTGWNGIGGGGGYPTGTASAQGGNGGTQTAVGSGLNGQAYGNNGGPLLGVSTYGSAPGGGGWYGGGGGGGGGSSYLGSSLGAAPSPTGIGPISSATFQNGASGTGLSQIGSTVPPGGTTSPYYTGSYGYPNTTQAAGNGGLIVFIPAVSVNPVQVGASATIYSI